MKKFVDRIIEGDCLTIMKEFSDGLIDMVLCDLPYGVTQNSWDTPINLADLWQIFERIVKPDGVVILTGQGVFTAHLIFSNLKWFKYKMVWIKSRATNFLNARKQPLRRHEDICVFYNNPSVFNPQLIKGLPYFKGIRKDNGSGNYGRYGPSSSINRTGERYPSDVLYYAEDLIDFIEVKSDNGQSNSYHPTQKPVNLGRQLITTFSRQGDVILDCACGSGSFMVAAVMEWRHYIGIDKNDHCSHLNGKEVDFIAICEKRIKKALYDRGQLFQY